IINTDLLYRHLLTQPDALSNLEQRATWFEPAFPANLFYDSREDKAPARSHSFFFYARPNNVRNLYWLGLEAIVTAMEHGVLDPAQWSFTFVGREVLPVRLPGGVVPQILENLPWHRYAE